MRFTAQTTAIAAKIRKRIASILFRGNRHQKGRHKQVDDGYGEHERPREAHQLIVAETGERSANPNKEEEDHADLAGEPEQGQYNLPQDRNQEKARDSQENDTGDGKGDAVKRARRIQSVIDHDQPAGSKNER